MLLWLQFCSFRPKSKTANRLRALGHSKISLFFDTRHKAELEDSKIALFYESRALFATCFKRLLFLCRFELLFLTILDRCDRETGAIVRRVLE